MKAGGRRGGRQDGEPQCIQTDLGVGAEKGSVIECRGEVGGFRSISERERLNFAECLWESYC